MELTFNKESKKLMIKAIEEVTGETAMYLGVPSFAYEIGDYRVEKDGTLKWEDFLDADPDHVDESSRVLEACISATGITPEGMNREPEEDVESTNEVTDLTIQVPIDKVNIENLKKILESKGKLIKKAFGIENTDIEVTTDKVEFPWFDETDPDRVQAYIKFISAICEMSVKQKRISAKEQEVPNEKYAFRCFLLRLGFIGEEYKKDRKILLERLEGSSAFKNPVGGEC